MKKNILLLSGFMFFASVACMAQNAEVKKQPASSVAETRETPQLGFSSKANNNADKQKLTSGEATPKAASQEAIQNNTQGTLHDKKAVPGFMESNEPKK